MYVILAGNRAMVRGYTKGNWPHWTLPVMYQICLSLRTVAILSDDQARRLGKTSEHLEDAARYINKAFTLCISDRYVRISVHCFRDERPVN